MWTKQLDRVLLVPGPGLLAWPEGRILLGVVEITGQIVGRARLREKWPQDWKRSVFSPVPKKGNAKECSNYHTIALISYASKVTASNST